MHIAIDQLICVARNRGLKPLGLSKDDLLRRACVNISSWQHHVTLLAHASGHMHPFILRPTAALSRWPLCLSAVTAASKSCVHVGIWVLHCWSTYLNASGCRDHFLTQTNKLSSYPWRYLTWTSGWPSRCKQSPSSLAFTYKGHSPPANRMATENKKYKRKLHVVCYDITHTDHA